jgi:predicted RND superfamily exporter protein
MMNEPANDEPTYVPQSIFGRLAQGVLNNRRSTSLSIFGVVLISVFLIWTRLGLDSNLLSLLPQEDPLVESIGTFQEKGAKLDQMSLAVAGDDEVVESFFEEMDTKLVASGLVNFTFYELDEDLALRLGAVAASKKQLLRVRDNIRAALALGRGAALLQGMVFSAGAGSEDLGTGNMKKAEDAQAFFRRAGTRTMRIRPSISSENVGFNVRFMRVFEEILEGTVRSETNLKGHDVEVVWIGGAYRHSYEDYEGVRADMRWTGLMAGVLIFLLLSLAFRSKRVVALVFVPLTIGTLLTFGFASLAVGDLNMFTSFFGAILIGLGIDFSVHLFTRYREERAQAASLNEAVVRAWDATGPPCFVAALTSAGGFFALMVGDFNGFSELGLLLGVGVMICLGSVLVILPLLISWWEKKPKAYRKKKKSRVRKPPTYRFAPLVLMLLALVTFAFSFALKDLEFEYDISELRQDGQGYSEMDEQQLELVQDSFAPVLVGFDSESELLEAHLKYEKLIEEEGFPGISGVFSIYSLLPPDQEERLAVLAQIRDFSSHESYPRLNQQVQQNLAPLKDLNLNPLVREDLPIGLLELTGATKGLYNLVLFADGNMWDLREARVLLDELEIQLGDLEYTGRHLINGVLYTMVRRDAPLICLVALLLVCLATLIDLKSLPQAMGAVSVLLAGMLWAVAAVTLFRIKISMVNVVGIAILLGIGVDVVIHLLHRIREEGPGRIHKALETTGWAAALSATTTVMSFASLSLAGGRGIRGLGQLVLVGLTAITIAAFLLLPTGWMTAWKLGGDMPDDMPDDEVAA